MVIGRLDESIAALLGIEMPDDPLIYLGEQNIDHMIARHPEDYARYGDRISEIVSHPDYVYFDPSDRSVEFIKEFVVFGEYVKVAVRATSSGALYARTLYVINSQRVENYIKSGKLKRTS